MIDALQLALINLKAHFGMSFVSEQCRPACQALNININFAPGELRVPCTKNGDVRCRLLEHRVAINTVLLRAGLEIMEDHRQAGGVRLAVNESVVYSDPVWATPEPWLNHPALEFAHDIIADHCCLTALEMYLDAPCPPRVVQALRRSRTLKRLAVFLSGDDDTPPTDMFALIHSITSLEELIFKPADNTRRHGHILNDGPLGKNVLKHLKVLDVRYVLVSPEKVRALLWALIRNHTVTELAVNKSVFAAGPRDPGRLFALYVARRRAVLKKLTLYRDCRDRGLWARLTKALSKATTLTELSLDMTIPTVTAELAQVALRCKTLRRLQLPRLFTYDVFTLPEQCTMAWIAALRANRSLSELHICVSGMSEAQFRSLLSVIANGETLRKVVIQDHQRDLNLEMLSRVIRELEMSDRIRFQNLHVSPQLSKVPELSCVKFERLVVNLKSRHSMEPLIEYANMFCRPGTSTLLIICCPLRRLPGFEDLLTWLAESSTLTHVDISVYYSLCGYRCSGCAELSDRVVSALATNPSITEVKLPFFMLETAQIDTLCNSAREHRSLIAVKFHSRYLEWRQPSADFQEAVMRLQDIVRQNTARFAAAVKYVTGEITGAGARAVEVLHNHPWLLEQVRDAAEVTEEEARELAERAFWTVCHGDVHDFMWSTGVVRERQATPSDPDAQRLHILDLPLLCWLHVRRYLKLEDVASG
ncbi:hypothetical protein MTO96_037378 [Rhipicephalus appendiculatus]